MHPAGRATERDPLADGRRVVRIDHPLDRPATDIGIDIGDRPDRLDQEHLAVNRQIPLGADGQIHRPHAHDRPFGP